MSRSKLFLSVAALLLLISTPIRTADQTLIAPGSTWKYNDSGANLGNTWSAPAYNDASWPSGAAQLGYGDGDESTVMSVRNEHDQPSHHVLPSSQFHSLESFVF